MFKFVVLAMVICAANAGLIGLGHGHQVVAVSHGATSYQNNNQISVHPVPVVATHHAVSHAPIAVAHAPVAIAHAPIAIAHAPVAIGHGIGLHGWH